MEYQKRREEILAAAQELFMQRGYENTSVESIIEKAGISKGTFYYYFKSKEVLLDTLAYDRATKAFEIIDRKVFDNHCKAVARMQLYFEASRTWKLENKVIVLPLLKMFYSPANLRLREKMIESNLEIAKPTLTRLVRQGVEEGAFTTSYPEDIAETLFVLFNIIGKTFAELVLQAEHDVMAIDNIVHKCNVYQDVFERILGAPKGSIVIADRAYLERFIGPT